MSEVANEDDLMSIVAEVLLGGGTTFGSGLPLSAHTDGSMQKTLHDGRINAPAGSLGPATPVLAPPSVPHRICS